MNDWFLVRWLLFAIGYAPIFCPLLICIYINIILFSDKNGPIYEYELNTTCVSVFIFEIVFKNNVHYVKLTDWLTMLNKCAVKINATELCIYNTFILLALHRAEL